MIEINLYTNNGEKTLGFKFKNPSFAYNGNQKWINISATGRTFTLNTAFLAFDEEIKNCGIIIEFGDLTHSQINEAYNNGKLIIIFSSTGVPIKMFYGDKIRFITQEGGLNHFQIDEKDLWFFDMSYLILTKN